jgi:glyoxylase-like metal-dependent hydrolase (beta-lactamase superfamily II)
VTDINWTLHVIEFARTDPFPWVDLVNGLPGEVPGGLPFSFVLAQRGDRNVLVDCGFVQEGDPAVFPRKHEIPHWVSPLRMLGELGVAPDRVTDIVVTHAHFDHMGTIGQFPNAMIHIQKSELLAWYEALALPRRYAHLVLNLDPDDMRDALEASIEHRINMIDGDRDNVLPGLHVRLGSGHTIGQQFVLAETARGRLLISGDCLYARENLEGHDHSGSFLPLNNAIGSVWEQLKTLDRIAGELAGETERLIIIHDTERWKGLPVVREIEGFRIVKAS